MTSMAAQLAASLPARTAVSGAQQQAGAAKPKDGGVFNVPARMEEALDVEGNIELKEVELNGMVGLIVLSARWRWPFFWWRPC